MTNPRIRIAESVMQKAGTFGLQDHDINRSLADILKKMARLSAIASGNFNEQRRRYGVFILTMRDNTVVDINCNEEGVICILCLGTEVMDDGTECSCTDEFELPDKSETVGGNIY